MLVTLNNGKTVHITIDQFLDKNDTEWAIFMDSKYGEEINDPFFGSQIHTEDKYPYDEDFMMDE